MKEKLYTIPIHDAFQEDCECPLCAMYRQLEEDAIRLTMAGYMVDDQRMESNKTGFCATHMQMLLTCKDKLGVALMLSTHMETVIRNLEDQKPETVKKSLFGKKKDSVNPVIEYTETVSNSCFVCNKIENLFQQYLKTVCYLYKKESDFRQTIVSSKGFCTKHYGMLYRAGLEQLSGKVQENFLNDITTVYLDNMKRVKEDLDWFIQKYDYRFRDEPWKNSKDAVERSLVKLNSIYKKKENEINE